MRDRLDADGAEIREPLEGEADQVDVETGEKGQLRLVRMIVDARQEKCLFR